MAMRETTYTWWGFIAAMAIVLGSGFYSKGSNVEPNQNLTLSVAINASADAGETSQ